jgi:MFS family permease
VKQTAGLLVNKENQNMEMIELSEGLRHSNKKARPWIICFAASLLFFYEFIQGTMFASIADNIMRDFHIEADKMIYLSSAYYLSNVVFLFVAGLLLERFSAKKMLIIAMFFCVMSTFILAHTDSFYVAFVCRFVIGAGSAFCFLGPIRIATRWFLPKQMAFVTGAVVTMAMSGGMLAQYPLMTLVLQVGWRNALNQVSWLGVVMLIAMMRLIQDKPKHFKEHVSNKKMNIWSLTKQAYFNGQTFLAGLYASLMNMGVAIFGAVMGQLYLVQRLGVTQDTAAMVNGMLFLGAMLGGPLIGFWSDKIRLRVLPMKAGALASLFIALAILYAPVSVFLMGVLFFLLGLTTSSQVISYPFVAERSQPILVASSISLVSMILQGGYIVYQNIYSSILISHGSMQMIHDTPIYTLTGYQMATLILPVSFFIAFLAIFGLKETHGRSEGK